MAHVLAVLAVVSMVFVGLVVFVLFSRLVSWVNAKVKGNSVLTAVSRVAGIVLMGALVAAVVFFIALFFLALYCDLYRLIQGCV